jgi:hypothetical protein
LNRQVAVNPATADETDKQKRFEKDVVYVVDVVDNVKARFV